MKKFLEAGKIVGTHGIQGEMRVECWCDSPEFMKGLKRLFFGEGDEEVDIAGRRVHKRMLLLTIKGIDSVEKADALRGRVLYLNREDVSLPEGSIFIQDLIGMTVVDADKGNIYGKITEVFATGANDVYRIAGNDGREYLFPAVPHMIEERSIEERWIKVRPIAGIFDDGGISDAD